MNIAAYGSWVSPITEEKLVEGKVGIGGVAVDGTDLYWIEGRPQEAGRNVIVKRSRDGQEQDLFPPPFNARTTVHEYGGGTMLVARGVVYFSNFADQRIYRVVAGQEPEAITPEGKQRYANYVLDGKRNRLIAVRENHDVTEGQPINELVAIPLAGSGSIEVLATGYDFYSEPSLDADGNRLAWLCWRHPNMPWDHTELWVAEIGADGLLAEAQRVAGEEEEALFQPEWTSTGALYFVSDRGGWWNLYAWDGEEVRPLHSMEAEFGQPMWSFGMKTYGFTGDGRTLVTYGQGGVWNLAGFDAKTGSLVNYHLPFTTFDHLCIDGQQAYFLGGSPAGPGVLVRLDLNTGMHEVLKRTSLDDPDPGYTSRAQGICFPTDNGLEAYGFYYPPQNKDYQAPEGTLPPLITIIHGGPTGAACPNYSLGIQYWTSRGFAIFDVNHGGSTGYGRAFRNRLRGQWGIVDVADAVNGARFLAEQGKADVAKLIIRGGSAGGYTTLAALSFHDVFRAGASYYGISDLSLLAEETHKFESRYPERLLAPWPEGKAVYEARSPILHLEGLTCPVILLQGLEDRVVPPNQSERIVAALKSAGVPVAYVPFEGEQHGFRQAANIIRAYQSELYFYAKLLGFQPPDGVEPVEIFNLEK